MKQLFLLGCFLFFCLFTIGCNHSASLHGSQFPQDSKVVTFESSQTQQGFLLLSTYDGIYSCKDIRFDWKYQTKQPFPSDPIQDFYSHPHTKDVWIGRSNRGIYVSQNGGRQWKLQIKGLQKPPHTLLTLLQKPFLSLRPATLMQQTWDIIDISIPSFEAESIYCATSDGVFQFTGKRWKRLQNLLGNQEIDFLQDIPDSNSMICIDKKGTIYHYLYKSKDFFKTTSFIQGTIRSIFPAKHGNLIVSSNTGIYLYTFSIETKSGIIIPLLLSPELQAIAYSEDTLFLTDNMHIFSSQDDGITLAPIPFPITTSFLKFIYDPLSNVYYTAANDKGIFYSTDKIHWQQRNYQINECAVQEIHGDPDIQTKLYACTHNHGVYASLDHGKSWNPSNVGMEFQNVPCMMSTNHSPTRLYAGTIGKGLFYSLDQGQFWMPQNSIMSSLDITALGYSLLENQNMIAATWDSSTEQSSLFYTTNEGWDWYPIIFPAKITCILPVLHSKKNFLIGTEHGLYIWDFETLFYHLTSFTNYVSCLKQDPYDYSITYLGTFDGVYKSVDLGETYVSMNPELSIGLVRDILIFEKDNIWIAVGNQIFQKEDENKWKLTTEKRNPYTFTCLYQDAVDLSVIYAGTMNVGVIHSPNNGKTWRLNSN